MHDKHHQWLDAIGHCTLYCLVFLHRWHREVLDDASASAKPPPPLQEAAAAAAAAAAARERPLASSGAFPAPP